MGFRNVFRCGLYNLHFYAEALSVLILISHSLKPLQFIKYRVSIFSKLI